MTDLREQVRMDFATAAAERRDALTAVGFPSSPLWLRLEAPICVGCGKTVGHVNKRGKCDGCLPVEDISDEGMMPSFGETYAVLVRGPM